jgi:hypothetical protein
MALTHKHEQQRRVALRSARRAARIIEMREKMVESLIEDMPKKDRDMANFVYMLGICQGYRIAKGWIKKKDKKWADISAVKQYLKGMKFYSRK